MSHTPQTTHNLPFFDTLILAVVWEARCTILLSEDFRHDFSWGGVKLLNPFAEPAHPMISHWLNG
jgi:predicted nucleic acid-binding protein